MDKARILRWTIGGMEAFEDLARGILLKLKLIKEDEPLTTGMALLRYIKLTPILKAAVGQAANAGEEDSAKIIDAYIEKGGSLEALEQSLYESFLMTSDPSHIAVWKEARQIEKDLEKINMEDLREKLEKAKTEEKEKKRKKGLRGGMLPNGA
jgi:hypothetical protein